MQEVPAGYDVLAADGAVLQVRVVGPDDLPRLRELFVRLSARTAYQRFLSASPVAGEEYVGSLPRPRADARCGPRAAPGGGRRRGVQPRGQPVDGRGGPASIDDVSQGHGLGTLMLEDLVARARARGLRELVALVLCRNVQMLQVFHDLGLPLRAERDGDTLSVTVDLEETPALEAALASREAAAAAASMERLLRPRSVAVLGSSGHRSDSAQQLLRRLRRAGCRAAVRAVNRFGPGQPDAPDGGRRVLPRTPPTWRWWRWRRARSWPLPAAAWMPVPVPSPCSAPRPGARPPVP